MKCKYCGESVRLVEVRKNMVYYHYDGEILYWVCDGGTTIATPYNFKKYVNAL